MEIETEAPKYPVAIKGNLEEPLSRWLWLVKWFLLIPHYLILIFLWIAFVVVSIIAFFAILISGRYPRGLFDFNVGVLRWTWRVAFYGYSALGTDKYPPFTLKTVGQPADPKMVWTWAKSRPEDSPPQTLDYPADLQVAYPERLSRGLVLIKWWLLVIPHLLIVAVFQSDGGLVGILVLIAAVILLFTGKYNKDIFNLVMGMNRWTFRVAAYAGLMTDKYPPFRFND